MSDDMQTNSDVFIIFRNFVRENPRLENKFCVDIHTDTPAHWQCDSFFGVQLLCVCSVEMADIRHIRICRMTHTNVAFILIFVRNKILQSVNRVS